jgi:hypothetical protein
VDAGEAPEDNPAMPPSLRRALASVLVILLMAFATSPRRTVGPVGTDPGVLAEAATVLWPVDSPWGDGPWSTEALYGMRAAAERPLAGASLALSAWLHTDRGVWKQHTASLLRVENHLLLLVAAWAAGRFARRMLIPWCGRDQARAAGLAITVLAAVHPLTLEAASPLAARGDLLGVALGALAALLFLRGRQERRHDQVLAAGVLAIAASFASPLALFLAPLLAVAEATSARRHRPSFLRWRTSLTTAIAFGIGVLLESIPRAWVMSRPLTEAIASGLGSLGSGAAAAPQLGAAAAMGLGVEKLGLVLLPVNLDAVGAGGYGLAGILLLLALQPALVAARSAPRLWGWILVGWIVALVVTEAARLGVRVHPTDLSQATILLLPTLVIVTGLGLCSTALSGSRRIVLPALLVLGYAALSHANANGWRGTAEEVDVLAGDLRDAARLHGWDATYFVVDPPGIVEGHDLAAPAVPALLRGVEQGVRTDVRALDGAALFAFLRTPEFAEVRARGLILLLPPAHGSRTRTATKVAAPQPAGPAVWREEGRSPQGVRPNPFETLALRVVARAEADTTDPPVMRWRGQAAGAPEGMTTGVWLEGEHGPVAVFDLTGQLSWLAGGRLRRIWFDGPLAKIASAALLPDVPPPTGVDPAGVEPKSAGADWTFALNPRTWPRSLGAGERTWALGLFAPFSMEYVEVPVQRAQDGRSLRAVGAAAAAEILRAEAGEPDAPLYWSLDFRIAGATVARQNGTLP